MNMKKPKLSCSPSAASKLGYIQILDIFWSACSSFTYVTCVTLFSKVKYLQLARQMELVSKASYINFV